MPSPSEPCAICEKETSMMCSACEEVYLCSRECQKKLWSFHRWLCGKPLSPFTMAPLSQVEANYLAQIAEMPYIGLDFRLVTWVEILKALQLWPDESTAVQSLLDDLQSSACSIAEPRRSVLLQTLRYTLTCTKSKAPPIIAAGPWAYLSALVNNLAQKYSMSASSVLAEHGDKLHHWCRLCAAGRAGFTQEGSQDGAIMVEAQPLQRWTYNND
ncbi:hypothetical protein JCM10213_005851 [Rhodosporidiobolus nylandii]